MKKAKIVLMLVSALLLLNCNKEDNTFQVTAFSQIDTDQGSRFTLTYSDGTERKIKGNKVFGSFNNQLLDGDYSKSFNSTAESVRFDFRFSIPKDIKSADVIDATHQLRGQRLKLQQTGNLGKLETEFWLGTSRADDEFDGLVNATGTAKYHQNISANDIIIEIAVEVECTVVNRDGQTVKIKGIFWKAKDDNI